MRSLSPFIIVFLLFATAMADPGDTLWTRVYGGEYNESSFDIKETPDGGYIIAGYSYTFGPGNYDAYLLKTDANGDTMWTKTYGAGGNVADYAYSVDLTGDGGYIFAGNGDPNSAGNSDVYLIRTDENGDTLWTRTYGGSDYELARSVVRTDDRGFFIGGRTNSYGAGSSDVYLVKTDSDGDTIWTRVYGGADEEYCWSVQQTADGGYIAGGHTRSFGSGWEDAMVLRMDAEGDTLWMAIIGGDREDYCRSIQQTDDGGFIFAGITQSYGAGMEDFWLVKLDSDGEMEWSRTFGTGNDEHALSVRQTSDGGYILCGYVFTGGTAWYNIAVVKTDSDGEMTWAAMYGGQYDDHGQCIRQTSDGNYIIAGSTRSYGAGAGDVYILKIEGEEQPEPPVSVEMVPDNPPVVVNPGGYFTFTGTISNNTPNDLAGDLWIMLNVPGIGSYGPIERINNIHLAAHQTVTIDGIRQDIPGFAPIGVYDYIACCGYYPNYISDSASFRFTVVAPATGNAGDWNLSGWSEEKFHQPSDYILQTNFPNPFNAVTMISFDLPRPGNVKLEIFNLMGQKAATLIDGWREAGNHTINWDASAYSSGIYFYKLSTGDKVITRRMTLLK
jgi:hypothetical protein